MGNRSSDMSRPYPPPTGEPTNPSSSSSSSTSSPVASIRHSRRLSAGNLSLSIPSASSSATSNTASPASKRAAQATADSSARMQLDTTDAAAAAAAYADLKRDDTFPPHISVQFPLTCKSAVDTSRLNCWTDITNRSDIFLPSVRSGHTAVCTATHMYVFGGYHERQCFSQVYRMHLISREWKRLSCTGDIPGESASHSMIVVGNYLLVFGGSGAHFGSSNSNKLTMCNLNTGLWTRINVSGRVPIPRYGQSMVRIRNYLYIFGGTSGMTFFNDLHRFNLDTFVWEFIPATGAPSERYRHEAVAVGDRFYVIGGGAPNAHAELLEEIFSFDHNTLTWSKHRCFAKKDTTKKDEGNRNGGDSDNNNNDNSNNNNDNNNSNEPTAMQIDSSSTASQQQQQRPMQAAQGAAPQPPLSQHQLQMQAMLPACRRAHSCVTHDGNIYMYGGIGASQLFDDLWKLDTRTFIWELVDPGSGSAPTLASLQALQHLPPNHPVVLQNLQQQQRQQQQQQQQPRPGTTTADNNPRLVHRGSIISGSAAIAPNSATNALSTQSTQGGSGTLPRHERTRPGARYFHSAAMSPSGEMLLFGGCKDMIGLHRWNDVHSIRVAPPSLTELCLHAVMDLIRHDPKQYMLVPPHLRELLGDEESMKEKYLPA